MRRAGFTLLEVLIALAILAAGLIVVMRVQGQAVLVSQYQEQQITAATLARYKMVEIELQLEKDGFGTDEVKEVCGNFGEEIEDSGFEGYDYCWTLTKVEIPLPTGEGAPEGEAEGGAAAGGAGSVIPGLDLASAGDQLSKAVRAVTLTITWKTGTQEQRLPVVTHFVNTTQTGIF